MIEVFDALSAHINEGLHRAGYPRLSPLLDGQVGCIVLGEQHDYLQLPAPRIIFRPVSSKFGPRDNTRGPVPLAANRPRPDAESMRAITMRAIHTETVTYEASVWSLAPEGVANPGAVDYEFTRALYLQLIASLGMLMPGCYALGNGTWRIIPHNQRAGREFVFTLTMDLPVLDELLPTTIPGGEPPIDPDTGRPATSGLETAGAGVTGDIKDTMVLPDGATGPGCEE